MKTLLIACVLMAGCANLPAGQLTTGQPITLATICVPPGLPPFAEWQMLASRTYGLRSDSGVVVPVTDAYYRAGKTTVRAWVYRAIVLTVDLDPENAQTPFLYDPGVLVPGPNGMILLDDGRPSCTWKSKAPYGQRREGTTEI